MSVALGICGAFLGCILNAIFLELIVKRDPGSGTLVTFSQFLFIALEGFIFTTKLGTKKRNIPINNYLIVVVVFFICNVCNNFAFDFKISMPLHMIFRSGSLITNMIMGMIMLNRRYPLSKYVSVCLITAGVIVCTVVTGQDVKSNISVENDADAESSFFLWLLGIALLVFALFVSALLGIFQEVLYQKYGKYPYEALFYTHMLPIPVFFIFYKNIFEHYRIMMNSDIITLPVININLPCMVVYLIGNVTTQYLCISSVYYLTTEATSLTVTLVITLRKFISLLLSIIYFGNKFTLLHWVGTFLVFIGTIIFTDLISKLMATFKSSRIYSVDEKKKL